jgi:hypothetical protein
MRPLLHNRTDSSFWLRAANVRTADIEAIVNPCKRATVVGTTNCLSYGSGSIAAQSKIAEACFSSFGIQLHVATARCCGRHRCEHPTIIEKTLEMFIASETSQAIALASRLLISGMCRGQFNFRKQRLGNARTFSLDSLFRKTGGSAFASSLSGTARRSFTLGPACSPSR